MQVFPKNLEHPRPGEDQVRESQRVSSAAKFLVHIPGEKLANFSQIRSPERFELDVPVKFARACELARAGRRSRRGKGERVHPRWSFGLDDLDHRTTSPFTRELLSGGVFLAPAAEHDCILASVRRSSPEYAGPTPRYLPALDFTFIRSTGVRNDATSPDLNKDHACTRRRLRKMSSTKDVLVTLCVLLLLHDHTSSLIIPEELPTILSLIYSNIPPIKKGTDSRVGVGFRLGEHADFQILVELGPQTETEPIGNADSKRRRNAMFHAAMRGELGPLAQAVAKYQTERKLQRELEKLKKTEEKQGETTAESQGKKTEASEWLSKWSKGMVKSSEDEASIEDISNEKSPSSFTKKNTLQRIGRPPLSNVGTGLISDLKTLYKEQIDQKN